MSWRRAGLAASCNSSPPPGGWISARLPSGRGALMRPKQQERLKQLRILASREKKKILNAHHQLQFSQLGCLKTKPTFAKRESDSSSRRGGPKANCCLCSRRSIYSSQADSQPQKPRGWRTTHRGRGRRGGWGPGPVGACVLVV